MDMETEDFLGGPVVFRPSDSKYYQVAGVIIKYAPEITPVYETELEAANDGSGKITYRLF